MAEKKEKEEIKQEPETKEPKERDEIEELKNNFRKVRKISRLFLFPTTAVLVFFWLSPWTLPVTVKYWILVFWRPALILWWLTYSFKIVKEYEKLVVQFFGMYVVTFEPGPKLIPYPLMTSRFVQMWEVEVDIPPQTVITKDNIVLIVDGLLNARVTDAYKSVFNVENPFRMLGTLAQAYLRDGIAPLDFDTANRSRERIAGKVLKLLKIDAGLLGKKEKKLVEVDYEKPGKKGRKKGWGVEVTRVRIQRWEPPEDIVKAMHLQAEAERKKRARILEAEGEKQATILIAEGEKEARINLGKGERRRLKEILEGIAKDPSVDKIIQLDAIKVLPEIADGKATKIYLPAELAGIAKIAELFKAKELAESTT